jgi:hypothetical protein
MTKDSSYIKKYVFEKPSAPVPGRNEDQKLRKSITSVAIWKDERSNPQKQLARPA